MGKALFCPLLPATIDLQLLQVAILSENGYLQLGL